MKSEKSENRKKRTFYIPAIVFIVFIFATAILFLALPKEEYSSSEKRYLEKFPEVSLQSIADGSFTEGFENYLADHFSGRNFWVGLNAYYNLYTGRNGADDVYKCKDDYLINVPVSGDNRLRTNAETIRAFAEKADCPVTMMMVPSTGYIMQDKLPANHFAYQDDQMFSEMQLVFSSSKVEFIDLRQSFKEAAQAGTQLYYKTDHHWTTRGAYEAYKQICSAWQIQPMEKEQFDIKSYGGFYGTTYSSSGFWMTPSDTIEIWENPRNTEKDITVEITEGDEAKTYHSMYFLNHLKEDDKYPVFLDGNHSLEKITNENADGGKLLIIKDSFSHCFVPFMAEHYREITTVDMRYYKANVSELVKENGYDRILVLYGVENLAEDTDLVWLK